MVITENHNIIHYETDWHWQKKHTKIRFITMIEKVRYVNRNIEAIHNFLRFGLAWQLKYS